MFGWMLISVDKCATSHVRLQGMSEDVSINRFFDDPLLLEMAR